MIDTAQADAPWRFGSPPDPARVVPAATLASRVEPVPETLAAVIEEEGLRAAPAGELQGLMPRAQFWLGLSPELERLVRQLVRDIHPLSAEPGYDVSHSQPRWREAIFVSCPERGDDVGALRLAESVVHEAMHLHLTNEEERAPLVAAPWEAAHSPWRDTARPVQGVMHGLFVFACIHHFLQTLAVAAPLDDDVRRHVGDRLRTITEEMAQVDLGELSRSLTPRGQAAAVLWVARGFAKDADGLPDWLRARARSPCGL